MHQPLSIHNITSMPHYFWHPSVVYVPEGFGGHKWWMAQSPYHPSVELKPYRARWELPCVHWSDDGLHWKSVPTNPIDDLTEQQVLEEDYLSDPHLVYKDGVLELYYRLSLLKDKQVKGNKTLLFRKTSMDGIHWSERELIADLRKKKDISIWGEQIISQSVLWDGKKYRCWYVDGSGYQKNRGIRVTESEDGGHWIKAEQCVLENYPDTPWHIDVQEYDGMYHMLCYGDDKGCVAHLKSIDGLAWHYENYVLHVAKSWKSFYAHKLYRSCSVKIEDTFYIFFSAATITRSYIGVLKTIDWKTFISVGPQWQGMYMWNICEVFVCKVIRKCKKVLKII